jgi:Baseplate hub gp41
MTTWNQWIRKYSLVVTDGTSSLDISQLKFSFVVNSSDIQTPNNADIKILNLAPATTNRIQNEFTKVVLQAGYQNGAYGTIFSGDIVQIHRGRENATDTFLRILAADGDEAYNFGVMSASLPKGSKPIDQVNAIAKVLAPYGIALGTITGLGLSALPRGKALFGMVRDLLDDICKTSNCTWSFQDGQLTILPNDGLVPGSAPIPINSQTGMVGIPTQTEGGIKVRCLLNPTIKIGSTIQLNNNDIVQIINKGAAVEQGAGQSTNVTFNSRNQLQTIPLLSSDGHYRVLAIQASGDTRANEWYYDLVTIAVDGTLTKALGSKYVTP